MSFEVNAGCITVDGRVYCEPNQVSPVQQLLPPYVPPPVYQPPTVIIQQPVTPREPLPAYVPLDTGRVVPRGGNRSTGN